MKGQNPVDHIRFYKKEMPEKAFRVRQENVSIYWLLLGSVITYQFINPLFSCIFNFGIPLSKNT